jgi:hypothetical protein
MNLFLKSFQIQRVMLDTLGCRVVAGKTCDSRQATRLGRTTAMFAGRVSICHVRLVGPSTLLVAFMPRPKVAEIQNEKCGKGDGTKESVEMPLAD